MLHAVYGALIQVVWDILDILLFIRSPRTNGDHLDFRFRHLNLLVQFLFISHTTERLSWMVEGWL